MSSTAPERAAALVRQGNRAEAVRMIRSATGVRPAEALAAVEQIERDLASGASERATAPPEARETIGMDVSPEAASGIVMLALSVLAALAAC